MAQTAASEAVYEEPIGLSLLIMPCVCADRFIVAGMLTILSVSNSNSRGHWGLKQSLAMLFPPIGVEARVR